jgi:beta-glucosidase
LSKSVAEGKITEEQINTACRRVLEAKYDLGLFADPYKYCRGERTNTDIYTPRHLSIARKIAAESFVLLKNAGDVLPLKKQGTIAVIGPMANTRSNLLGTWCVSADLSAAATLVEGLTDVAGKNARIVYAKGSNLMADADYEKRVTGVGHTLYRDDRSAQQLLQEALEIAESADVIVAALGETSEMTGESSSRTGLNIPDVQQDLLKALLETGKPVALVLFTGRPLTLVWEDENAPAILNVWHGGSEAARAIGDVLFGDVNPSGKLTATFPKNVGQIPVYYNHKNTGRPIQEDRKFEKYRSNYLDIDNEPLYPFGYGLSYTQFEYSDVKLSATRTERDGKITASVTVTNKGKRDGAEVVQLYIRDKVGSVTRPLKELKGFEKVFIEAGKSKVITFQITPDLLEFYNYNLEQVLEPGDFDVMIGGNSRDVKTAGFTVY